MAKRKAKNYEDASVVLVGEMPVCNTAAIPRGTARVMGQCILDAVAQAFQRPDVQEDYLRWKAERERRMAVCR